MMGHTALDFKPLIHRRKRRGDLEAHILDKSLSADEPYAAAARSRFCSKEGKEGQVKQDAS